MDSHAPATTGGACIRSCRCMKAGPTRAFGRHEKSGSSSVQMRLCKCPIAIPALQPSPPPCHWWLAACCGVLMMSSCGGCSGVSCQSSSRCVAGLELTWSNRGYEAKQHGQKTFWQGSRQCQQVVRRPLRWFRGTRPKLQLL